MARRDARETGGPALDVTIVAGQHRDRPRRADHDRRTAIAPSTATASSGTSRGTARQASRVRRAVLEATFGEVIGVAPGRGRQRPPRGHGQPAHPQRWHHHDRRGLRRTGLQRRRGPRHRGALNHPVMLAVAVTGTLYFSEHHNDVVRRVSPDGGPWRPSRGPGSRATAVTVVLRPRRCSTGPGASRPRRRALYRGHGACIRGWRL